MIFQSKQIPAFGLDIGDQTLKLVSLVPSSKYTIINHNSVTLPEGAFVNGKIVQEEVVIKHLRKLVDEMKGPKLKTKFVHSCLPDTQTFIKLINIPEMTEKEIPEAVRWASEHHIPMPPESIYIDWQVLRHDKSTNQIEVLIGAAPKELSDSYTTVLKKSGLTPLSLEIEATATARALLDEHVLEKSDASVALIDMGATRTGLTVVANNAIQFTSSLPFSGSDITATVSKKLELDTEQAEQAKRVCGFNNPECEGALREILNDKLDELITKLTTAFNFYKKNFEHAPEITSIVLCGGGAHFTGIDEVIKEKLQLEVHIGNPLLHCQLAHKSTFPKQELLAYTTSIGLALKVYE